MPYNLLNLVCAGLPTISLRHFMLALCVVTSRVVLTLYIAGTLSDIASHEANHGSHVSPAKWIELGISIALFMLFILASSRFYNIMRRKWEQQQSQEDQEQQHQGMQEEQLEGSRMAWHDMEALSGSLLDIPSIQTLQS